MTQSERDLVLLCAGPPGERPAAWARWIAALRQPEGAAEPYPAHWRDLLPLAALRQREAALAGPDWLLSRLRAAALIEERRLVAVEDTAAAILASPVIAAHEPLMLGGLGLGQTVYPDPATRHTGIIALLLRPGTRLRPLMHALVADGYVTRDGGWRTLHVPFRRHARVGLKHPSAMKLLLLSAPVWRTGDPLGYSTLRGRAALTTAGKARFYAPALPDALALSTLRLTGEGRASLVPHVDAALLGQALANLSAPTQEP